MKRFLLLLSFAVFAGLLGGCSKKLDPVQTATEFFDGVGQGKIGEVYDSTAFGFQSVLPLKSFEAVVKSLGLTGKTVVCAWGKPVISDGEVRLEGTVTAADGTKVPMSVVMIRERGRWCIFRLHSASEHGKSRQEADNRFSLLGKGLAFNDASNRELPSEKVIRQLVEDDLMMFNDALQRHSFAIFYSSVSYSWQQQLTLKQLQHAFQPFIDKKVNLGPLRTLSAIFDAPPAVDPDGLLIVVGHYPSQPYHGEGNPSGTFKVYFTLRYTYELPKWKLLGIDVQLTK